MSNPVSVGLVGYGNSAKKFHLPFIQATPTLKLVAILQRAEAPAEGTAAPGSHCTVDHPNVRHHRTADEFFADADIELVVVATHIDTHALMAKLAILAGKHVVVDKPFARSTEEVDEVMNLARDKNLIVSCYQNRRWDGDFKTLQHLLKQDALGTIKEAELHYDFQSAGSWFPTGPDEYEPGIGMSFGLGTHSVDQALTLWGCPKSVTAFFRAQRGGGSVIEDSFTIVLQYDEPQKDLLVTIKSSVTTIMAQQLKYMVRGTAGSYLKMQQRSTCVQEERIALGGTPTEPNFGVESEKMSGTLTTLQPFDARYQKLQEETGFYVGSYPTFPGYWRGIYENVAAAVRGEAELEVKLPQIRNTLRVIELAKQSQDENRTVYWS